MAKKKQEICVDDHDLHFVVYTDGGCRPKSRGFAGSGFHGYTAIGVLPKQGSGAKQTPTLTRYEAEKKNPCTVIAYHDWWRGLPGEQTNNIAEMTAFIRAVNYALEINAVVVNLHTDSEYVKKGYLDYLDGWVKKGFIGGNGPIKNKELWIQIAELKQTVLDKGVKLTIHWVKGHDNDLGNTTADTAATRGVILAMKGKTEERDVVVSDPKGYWSNKSTYNRFLSKTRVYFNTNVGDDYYYRDAGVLGKRYAYYLGKHGPDDSLIGKRVSDVSFGLVYLKEPDPVLKSIMDFQTELRSDGNRSLVVGKIDAIMNPNIYAEIEKHGSAYLQKDVYENNIIAPNKTVLTVELDPPRVAANAIEVLNELDFTLTRIIDAEFKSTEHHMLTDVTDVFYENGKLSKKITQSIKHVDLMVAHGVNHGSNPIKQRFLLDMDLPSRNALSALASDDVRVYAVTWRESPDSFRFATIVVSDGEMGIWSTAYSNLRIVK